MKLILRVQQNSDYGIDAKLYSFEHDSFEAAEAELKVWLERIVEETDDYCERTFEWQNLRASDLKTIGFDAWMDREPQLMFSNKKLFGVEIPNSVCWDIADETIHLYVEDIDKLPPIEEIE